MAVYNMIQRVRYQKRNRSDTMEYDVYGIRYGIRRSDRERNFK